MDNYTLYNTIALHSWIFIVHHSRALSISEISKHLHGERGSG